MAKALRILLVEDNYDDLHLIVRELTRGGYAPVCRQVYTETGLRARATGRALGRGGLRLRPARL